MEELIDQAAPDAQTSRCEQWGVDFFREPISEQRLLRALKAIAGQRARASISPDPRRQDAITAGLTEALEQEVREHEETLAGEPAGADPAPS